MTKFWLRYKVVILLFFGWRLFLYVVEVAAPFLWPLRTQFLNPIRWANMDGGHYLFIARAGYGLYEQAFFPIYPLMIRLFSFLSVPLPMVGLLISHVAFFFGLLLFYDIAAEIDKKSALWSVLFLLLFPTSFFFAAVYSTSLYFFLSVFCVRALQKRQWILAGLSGMFASATSVFGVFLIIPVLIDCLIFLRNSMFKKLFSFCLMPLGLGAYMVYLAKTTGDPLRFFHVQSAFGAQRNVIQFIWLPQVLWRYGKILATANPHTVEYGVAVLEISAFLFAVYLAVRAFWSVIPKSYSLYALCIIILPTFTGTLTSFPRYVLDAFPLFILLGMRHNKAFKISFLACMIILLVICTSLFLQGYFVA